VLVLQVGKFLQLISTFIGGFIIAFIKGWLLTIVLCSAIPLLVIAGAMMTLITSKMALRGQSAYAKAANVVEQTIGAIKTVSRFVKTKYFLTSLFKQIIQFFSLFFSKNMAFLIASNVGCIIYRGEASYSKLQQISCTCLQVWCSGRLNCRSRYWHGYVNRVFHLFDGCLFWCKVDTTQRIQWGSSDECDYRSLKCFHVSCILYFL
jgi:hypothetical protein